MDVQYLVLDERIVSINYKKVHEKLNTKKKVI